MRHSDLRAVVNEVEVEAPMVDRRVESGWRDPRLYVAILSVLLALFLWLANRVSSQLETISTSVQAIAVSNSKQTEQISNLQRAYDKLEARVTADETNANAYTNQQAVLLTAINTKLNMMTERKK